MRSDTRRGVEPAPGVAVRSFPRWSQAGFSSFAYRLAHLSPPRPVSVLGVVLLFYLV